MITCCLHTADGASGVKRAIWKSELKLKSDLTELSSVKRTSNPASQVNGLGMSP